MSRFLFKLCPLLILSGYSLRKHIGNALRSRLVAIRTAVAKYNIAAANLSPPRLELSWEEVVEYAFLADFDLLRDARQDIRSRPWATPAARQAMDGYFKLIRAEEEIARLNVEIRRFLTFMRDEDVYLCSKAKEVSLRDPALAYQISVQRNDVVRFTAGHVKNLNEIQQLPGFSGNLLCGIRLTELSLPAEPSLPTTLSLPPNTSDDTMVEDYQADMEADLEEEQAGEDEEEAVLAAYCSILEFTCDSGSSQLNDLSSP